MRLLLVHNHYQQPGGEDQVFSAEAELLESRGHEVDRFTVHNDQVKDVGTARLALETVWNQTFYRSIRERIRKFRPDVVHVHNTLPLISPAVFHAAHAEKTPVVLTLHNYRLLCPNGLLLREGKICEQCVGRTVAWPGVVHACYRGSRGATAAVAAMLTTHRVLGTWTSQIDTYVALTDFARRKFMAGGLPGANIVVKPNFLNHDPGAGEHKGDYGLFVGRLSSEKGLDTLLDAWKHVNIKLMIAGDGPDKEKIGRCGSHNIQWVGALKKDRVLSFMKDAAFFVFPSIWYETFGLTILEAFATGLPVIASRLGSAAEIVEDGRTGLHFDPGDPADLAAKISWAIDHPEEMREMGRQARAEYELKYTAAKNYEMLISNYEKVIAEKRSVPVMIQ
jgi:glycosyltransferase involved in cell wall biosynthesis